MRNHWQCRHLPTLINCNQRLKVGPKIMSYTETFMYVRQVLSSLHCDAYSLLLNCSDKCELKWKFGVFVNDHICRLQCVQRRLQNVHIVQFAQCGGLEPWQALAVQKQPFKRHWGGWMVKSRSPSLILQSPYKLVALWIHTALSRMNAYLLNPAALLQTWKSWGSTSYTAANPPRFHDY